MPYLSLHVTPKSSKNEVVGWVDAGDGKRALKVRVAAPPEDGKANAELIRFLARSWGVPRSSLSIASGENSRHKRLEIRDESLYTRLMSDVTKASL